jgi:hypothetical protein
MKRISFFVLPRNDDGLTRMAEKTGINKTDLLNRAIALLRFITLECPEGTKFLIEDRKGNQKQVLIQGWLSADKRRD